MKHRNITCFDTLLLQCEIIILQDKKTCAQKPGRYVTASCGVEQPEIDARCL
jgi:hypothetical protein